MLKLSLYSVFWLVLAWESSKYPVLSMQGSTAWCYFLFSWDYSIFIIGMNLLNQLCNINNEATLGGGGWNETFSNAKAGLVNSLAPLASLWQSNVSCFLYKCWDIKRRRSQQGFKCIIRYRICRTLMLRSCARCKQILRAVFTGFVCSYLCTAQPAWSNSCDQTKILHFKHKGNIMGATEFTLWSNRSICPNVYWCQQPHHGVLTLKTLSRAAPKPCDKQISI